MRNPRVLVASIASLLTSALLLPTAADAAPVTWDGSADASWSVIDNWDTGAEPTLADDAIFPNLVPASGSTITLSAGEQAGTLSFLNSYTLSGGDLTLGAATTIGVDPTFTATISSVLAGAGTSLTKTGAGTLVLSNTNTYTGKTIISGGTISISADTNLGAVPATLTADQVQLNGGTLKFTAGMTIAANRGFVSTAAGSVLDGNGQTLVFNAPITQTGASSSLLFTTSSGTATTFTLNASAGTNSPATTAVTIDGNVTVNLGSNTGSGNIGGNSASMTINSGGILRFNRNNATSYNADIGGAGVVTLANNSGQAVTLNPTTNNTYSGGTNINGSNATVLGTKDSAFGTGPINFVASAGTVASNNTTARNYGNNIFLLGTAAGTATLGQTATGTGALTFGNLNLDRVASAITRTVATNVATTFTAINDSGAGAAASNLAFTGGGTRNITAGGTFSGNLTWSSGLVNVAGPTAALANVAAITQGDNGGADETINFGAALVGGLGETFTTPGGLNRINDSGSYTFNGTGAFTYNGANSGSTGNTETIGTVSITSGRAHITLNPSSDAPLGIIANTLNRSATTTMLVRGTDLGTVAAGKTTFVIGNAASLLSGGGGTAGSTNISILPWAVGDIDSAGGGSGFVTHDAGTGLRLLAANEYDSFIAGAGLLRNVRAAGGETVSDSVTINSLRLTGGTTTIADGVRLRPASGAVLISGGGVTLAGPGMLEFGTSEGIINTANVAAITPTVSARLSGTGGLTFAGSHGTPTTNQVVLLSGDNIASGTYTVNTGVTLRLGSSAAMNDNSPATLALKPGAIFQINGNNAAVRNLVLTGFSGTIQNNGGTDATLTAYQLAPQTLATGNFINNGSTGKLNLVFNGNNANTTTIANTSGNYSYTGTTEVRTGTVNISGASAGFLSGTTGVIINGGTLQVTNTSGTSVQSDRLNNAATVTLNTGTFDFNNNANSGTNYTEIVGGVTLNSGANTITVDKATTSQTSTLTFASLARNPGSWVLFNSQLNGATDYTLGASTQSRLVFTTPPTLDDGLIGGWAISDVATGTRNFATYTGSTVTLLSGQVSTLASGANPTVNYSITATPAALTGNTQINSLVVTPAAAATVALGGNTLRIESGGLLTQGAQNTTFSGGTLTAGNGDNVAGELVINTVASATTTIASTAVIADNGTGSVSLTKVNVGTLDLTGANNTFTGSTYLNGGTTRITTGDAAFGTAPGAPGTNVLSLSSGATLDATGSPSFTLNANRAILVGAGTNIISIGAGTAGNGKTLTYNGSINGIGTTEGSLTFKSNLAATSGVDTGDFSGTLSALNLGGTFTMEAGTATVTAASSTIGRGLLLGTNGLATLTYNSAGGSLTIGKGVSTADNVDIGVVNTDFTPANTFIGTTTLDASALASLTINSDTMRVGVSGGNRFTRGVLLGATNTEITAQTSLTLANAPGASAVGQSSNIVFGTGTGSITTPLLVVGALKGEGAISIAAGGTLSVGGFGANTQTLYIGRNNGSTGTVNVGTLNTTGGSLVASLNSLIIAEKTGGGAGGATGTFTVTGTGNNISANTVTIGSLVGDNAATTFATVGALNFGGGTFTVNNDVALATHTTNTVGTPTVTGRLNITGGTFTLGGNITRTTDNETRSNSFVTVDGGTLDGLNTAAGDASQATITASQLAFRSGSITNVASATLQATSSTNSGIAGTTGDALIVRDTTINFPVTLTGATAGNVHYEAAGAGTGGTIAAVDLGAAGRTFNVENSANATTDLTVSGAITGSVSLTKTGTGTLALNGNSAATFTGATSLTAGALLVNGSLGAGGLTMSSGTTLGGSGTIGSPVTVVSGATLAPGNSPGKLTIDAATTFAAGSNFSIELNGNAAGTEYDQLAVGSTGGVTIDGGTFALTLGFAAGMGEVFTVIDNLSAGLIAGDGFDNLGDAGTINATFGGGTWTFQADYEGGTGNDLTLTVVAIPEPGSFASLIGGLGVLLGLQRFRGRRA